MVICQGAVSDQGEQEQGGREWLSLHSQYASMSPLSPATDQELRDLLQVWVTALPGPALALLALLMAACTA